MNSRKLGMRVAVVPAILTMVSLVSAQQRGGGAQEPPGSLTDAIKRAFEASAPVLQPDATVYILPSRVLRPSNAPWATPSPGRGSSSGGGAGAGGGAAGGRVIQYQIGMKDQKPLYAQFAIPADEKMFEDALNIALKEMQGGRPEAQSCSGQYVCEEYNPDGSCKRKKCVPKKPSLRPDFLVSPQPQQSSWK